MVGVLKKIRKEIESASPVDKFANSIGISNTTLYTLNNLR